MSSSCATKRASFGVRSCSLMAPRSAPTPRCAVCAFAGPWRHVRTLPASSLVTPADVTDNLAMLDLLHRVRFRWQLQPKRAIADAKYGTTENIVALEAAGIRAYLAMPDFGDRSGYYGPARFRYDPERDRYICPQE